MRRTIREGLNLSLLRAEAPDRNPLDYPLLEEQIALQNYPTIPEEDFLEAAAKIEQKIEEDGEIFLSIATVNSGYLPAVAEELMRL